MKETRRLQICILIIAFTCLLLAGCSKEERLSSISLKGQDPNTAVEIPIGVFDYGSYTLVATYDSGSTVELPLTEEMLVEADIFKLYREGEHDITVSYGGKTCTFKVSVKRGTLGTVKFPDSNIFLYDGTPHTVEVEGELPANAVVTYPGGNSFVNAGTYDVTAIVTCEGYVTQTVSTTVTVQKARYDTAGLQFLPKEVVYDGASHSVAISGELPAGVGEPTYYVDGIQGVGATDAGEYRVTAVFPNNNPNYEPIPGMETTLKILPAEYEMPELSILFENEDGSAIKGEEKVYDGASVVFDIDGRGLLSNKVTVSFTVFDEEGTVISTSNTETNIQNAGIYTVKAEFSLQDQKNYKAIAPIVHTFEITKATYDLSGIYFDSDLVEYDGEVHGLTVALPLDFELKAEDVTYEYYLDGNLQPNSENGVSNAGKYTVKATFAVKNENFEPIPQMQATLIIETKTLDISALGFENNTRLIYTGESRTVGFRGLPMAYLTVETVIYRVDGDSLTEVAEAKEVGTYRCVVTVRVASSNYVLSTGGESKEYVCNFEIVSAEP